MAEFKAWPKTPRLFRDITITEKIDGTNAAVQIVPASDCTKIDLSAVRYVRSNRGEIYAVYAQSRKRLITPTADNFGFAEWVWEHADCLVEVLGKGVHFGEWWGQGIQRKYNADQKYFSLFNTVKWAALQKPSKEPTLERVYEAGLRTVPVLYEGPFSQDAIEAAMDLLRTAGSTAAPGFMNPEGIIVYHHAANSAFKITLDNDGVPKTQVHPAA